MDAQTTMDFNDLAGYVWGESLLFYNTLTFWRKEGEKNATSKIPK